LKKKEREKEKRTNNKLFFFVSNKNYLKYVCGLFKRKTTIKIFAFVIIIAIKI